MLWLALASLIASDPAALSASPQMGPMSPLSAQTARTPRPAEPSMAWRTLAAPAASPCRQGIQRTDDAGHPQAWPTTDGRVRLHRLFTLNDAQGCPIPVIARDFIPEADRAIGHEIH